MEVRVLWTESAIGQLESIFEYYKTVASVFVAKKIVKSIILRTKQLKRNKYLGTREELLLDKEAEYYFIIEGHYKVIYSVNENSIIVASIFDCRQNPEKIEKIE
jgi:toxin ParE1/3/4